MIWLMPRKNLFFLVTGGASFILFVFFSYLVHKDVFTQFDFDTTVRLQDMISRRFDELFSYFSAVGSFEPMAITLVVIVVVWRKIVTGAALFSDLSRFMSLNFTANMSSIIRLRLNLCYGRKDSWNFRSFMSDRNSPILQVIAAGRSLWLLSFCLLYGIVKNSRRN